MPGSHRRHHDGQGRRVVGAGEFDDSMVEAACDHHREQGEEKESVLNSLLTAQTTTGLHGRTLHALPADFLHRLPPGPRPPG